MKKHATPEEVWSLLRESQKTSEKLKKESAKEIQELRILQKEASNQIKETADLMKNTDRKMQETDRQMQETDRRMKVLQQELGGIGKRWGNLMESLVRRDLIKLFQEKNIKVEKFAKIDTFHWNKDTYQYDMIAINGREVVVIEVKTNLTIKKIDRFIKRNLRPFKQACPEYKNRVVYGGIAFLKANKNIIAYANDQGLFVIQIFEDTIKFINPNNFIPQEF